MKQSHPIRLARLPLATLLFALTLPALAATTQTRSFEYDALGRLTSTSRNTTSEAYQYDASGNRTQFTVGSHGTTHLVASQNTGGQF